MKSGRSHWSTRQINEDKGRILNFRSQCEIAG